MKQRFGENPGIVSDSVFVDDAPKYEDGEPLEETTLEEVRWVVWAVLFANGADTVSRFTDGPARMTAVVAVACQEFRLIATEG